MQCVVAAGGEIGVDIDQVAYAADLGRQNDLVVAQPVTLGGFGRLKGADDHRFHHHFARGRGIGPAVVLIHHAGQQSLIERAPVHADAHRFLVLDRALHHDLEIVVVFLADRCVARVDAVLGQRAWRSQGIS